MSKAFVREDAETTEPEAEEPAFGPEPRYVTPEGYARLAAELAQLARGERRARYLTRLLEKLTVVGDAPDDRERVFFGARVKIEDAAGGRTEYHLVGPDETDVAAGRISVESPIARALLGKRAGDPARIRRPKGDTAVLITAVRYESP
jgi:transcription elongation factor GreB